MARRRDTEKPSQIIDAAFTVFGDIGYESTLIKDIAEKAGISSGTIYTYFHDKKDLFRATVQEGWDRFLAQVVELADSPEPTGRRLERFIDIGFSSLKTYLPLLRGMLFESSQMNILQQSLERLCALTERLMEGRRQRLEVFPGGPSCRRSAIKVTVVGLLFTAALADPSRVDQEIDELKVMVQAMLAGA
jgi:AcrR family transcriptional regulator